MFSNSISFEGQILSIYNCIFNSNSPYFEGQITNLEQKSSRGGAILFIGMALQIRSSYFINNTKSLGGAISIGDKSLYYPAVLISNCIFLNMTSNYGAIQIYSAKIKLIKITNNHFQYNFASTGII